VLEGEVADLRVRNRVLMDMGIGGGKEEGGVGEGCGVCWMIDYSLFVIICILDSVSQFICSLVHYWILSFRSSLLSMLN
jgi:hypothetical protein